MNLIELSGVTFAYNNDEGEVLSDLTLAVKQGECLVVEGQNGSGKTTLFRILNGLLFPQSGSYTFNNVQITEKYLKNNKNAKLFHKQIGYLFQNPDIMLFNASVHDEVAFGPRQMGLSDEEIEKRTNDCLKLFDIEHLADKAPYHLSSGQKKRVAFASIMSLNPDVMILDEPFAGLDDKTQDFMMAFLKDCKRAGKTIIIATHLPMVREALADKTLVLG